jgi:2'-5' RNA ligase/ribosomal protein S18 acetylase RimI-like enzyme
MPRRRLGVALLVPAPLDKEVDGLRRALGDPARSRIPPHVTLVPPVNVREEDLPGALSVLRLAAAATRGFRATLGPGATFLPESPVVYLTLPEGATGVEELRRRVLVAPLDRRVGRPFVPHVTVRDDAPLSLVDKAVAALASFSVEVRFTALHLLEEGEGRVWSPIADFPFRGPAVIGRGGLPLSLSVTGRLDPEVASWADQAWEGHQQEELGPAWSPERPVAITARRDEVVVGLAQGRVRGHGLLLDRLVVDPVCRSEGVGSHLLSAVCSLAAEQGCLLVRAVVPGGSRSAAYLEGRGFSVRRSLPAWWDRRDYVEVVRLLAAGDDEVVSGRRLSPGASRSSRG